MKIETLFNFTLNDDLGSTFLMTGDYSYLKEKFSPYQEITVGSRFSHDNKEYEIVRLINVLISAQSVSWSVEEHEGYRGKPCNANTDVFFECSEIEKK